MKGNVPQMDSLSFFPDGLLAADSLPVADTAIGQPLPLVAGVEACPSGMQGNPLPYRLAADPVVALLLFLGVFFLACVLHAGKKHLLQRLRGFFHFRMREDAFESPAAVDGCSRLFILLAASLVLGVAVFACFHGVSFSSSPGGFFYAVLALDVLVALAYFLTKWLFYAFLGWLFFDRPRTSLWIGSYFSVVYAASVLLCSGLLLWVYADGPAGTFMVFFIFVAVMAKISVFYNCIKFFSFKFYGLFYLIVYFCALEIMPCLIMYKGLSMLNNLL